MKRNVLILAIILIVIGVVGLVALNAWQFTSLYSNTALPFGAPGPYGMMGGSGWNAKYSPMARMVGGWFTPRAQNTVTPAQAKDKAQQYLDTYLTGAKVADDANAFYGYYTLDVARDGKTFGMLSVNGTTGVVWYHTWHGTFVNEKEFK